MPVQEKSPNTLVRWHPVKFVVALITRVMLGVTPGYWNNEEKESLEDHAPGDRID